MNAADAKKLAARAPASVARQLMDAASSRPGVSMASESRSSFITIWIPGLKLWSVNKIMGAAEHRTRLAYRKRAKAEARAALAIAEWRGVEARMQTPCALTVAQEMPTLGRIDVGNYWHKPLIDLLTARHEEGIGIIPDDSPKYLPRVTQEARRGELGVYVMIESLEFSP